MTQLDGYFRLGPLSGIILGRELTYLKYPKITDFEMSLTEHLELFKAAKPFLDSQKFEEHSHDRFLEFVYRGGKVNMAKYIDQMDDQRLKNLEDTKSLMHTAVQYGNFDLVKYMVSKGLTEEEISSGLGSAIVNEEPKIFKYLSKEIDIGSKEYQNDFDDACGQPSFEIIRLFVIAGININDGDDWALLRVCDSEYYEDYRPTKGRRYEPLDRVKYLFFYYGPDLDEDIKRIDDGYDNKDDWSSDKVIREYIHSPNKLEVAKKFIRTLYTKDLIKKL